MWERKGMLEHADYLQTVWYHSWPPPFKSSSFRPCHTGLTLTTSSKTAQVGAGWEDKPQGKSLSGPTAGLGERQTSGELLLCGKKWPQPMWMDLANMRPDHSCPGVFLRTLLGVMQKRLRVGR